MRWSNDGDELEEVLAGAAMIAARRKRGRADEIYKRTQGKLMNKSGVNGAFLGDVEWSQSPRRGATHMLSVLTP